MLAIIRQALDPTPVEAEVHLSGDPVQVDECHALLELVAHAGAELAADASKSGEMVAEGVHSIVAEARQLDRSACELRVQGVGVSVGSEKIICPCLRDIVGGTLLVNCVLVDDVFLPYR